MPKVKKIDAPVLILGLGGTGFSMLMRTKSEFNRRFEGQRFPDGTEANRPPRTEYLEIDTESGIGDKRLYGMKLENGEFVDIGGDFETIKGALGRKNYVTEWLDPRLEGIDVTRDGAGCYRQVSRLMLFDKFNNIRMALSGKLNSLGAVNAANAARNSRISVKLMAGISGGTGSGTILDIAYILRDIARRGGYRINIEAYLMMPDVTIAHNAGGSDANTKLYSSNSYAFLKELDFWMDAETTGVTLQQQYTNTDTLTWTGAPFDDVYLLCSQNDHGVNIENAYEHNTDAVAEYLVHCYESSDAAGNESFEVVDEEGKGDGGATNDANAYGFQSAHSNQSAIISMMHHPYPMPTRYHSLGAYSNAGEDRLMELQEWSMIYDEAISRFDTHKAIMDGLDIEEFKKNVMSLDTMQAGTASAVVRQGFNQRHTIPSFDGFDVDTLRSQDGSSAPHGTAYANFADALRHSKGNEEIQLAEDIWSVFLTQARLIGQDIKRGPEYLYAMLSEGENCLGKKVADYGAVLDGKKSTAASDMQSYKDHCKSSFEKFLHPGVLGGILRNRQNYEDYMAKVQTLYNATQADAYYAALKEALNDFQKRLSLYTAVLGDIVTAIRTQKNAYEEDLRKARANTTATLFDTGAMANDLTQKFADQDKRDTLVQGIYNSAIAVTERMMDAKLAPSELPALVNQTVDAMRENMFVAVGGLSLTQKIQTYQHVGDGAALQNYVSNQLCAKLRTGAEVMFYPSPESMDLPNNIAVHVSMITLPQGATDIEQGIRAYCKNNNLLAIIKHTQSSDRIFWVNDKGGLPMYFYGYIDVLRRVYIESKRSHKAYHLYMNENPGAINDAGLLDQMKQPWGDTARIPDPFIQREVRETGEAAEQLKEAEKQGVLKLDYKFNYNELPAVNAYKCVFKKIDGVTPSETTIQNALDAIPFDRAALDDLLKLEPNQANKAQLQQAQKLAEDYRDAIVALDDNRTREPLTFSHLYDAATDWGNKLGVSNKLRELKPSYNPTMTEEIKDAWTSAYGRAIREALSRRLDVVAEMDEHVKLGGLVKARLAEAEALVAKAKARIAEIPEQADESVLTADCAAVARMLMYDLLKVLRVKITTTVIEGPSAEVYNTEDPHVALERMYGCFSEFPILLQFAAWYSAGGKNEPGAIALAMEKAERIQREVSEKEDRDAQTDEIKARATEWRTKLEGLKQNVMMAYADHALDRDAYNTCNKLLEMLNQPLGHFIRTW